MPVRLTLDPDEDVELPDGARLGDLRADLADLVRRPELLRAVLVADGRPVDDDARVGSRPLLPGTVLSTARPGRPTPPAADVAALRSRWFLAAGSGPAAGEPRVLAVGVPLTLEHADARVRVTASARERVRVRLLPWWRTAGGSRRPVPWASWRRRRVALVPPSGRRRRLGPRPRRWRPGHLLDVEGATYALHPSGDVDVWLRPPEAPTPTPARVSPAMLATGLVPVVGSVALAVVLRQPLYALFSLVALVGIVPQVVAARRQRDAAAAGGRDEPVEAGADPGATAARVVAAHQASDGAWLRACRTHAAARPAGGDTAGRRSPAASDLLPDGSLCLRGPSSAVRAVARAVVVDLAAAGAAVRTAGAGRHAWRWCRWVAPGGDDEDCPRLLVVDTPTDADLATADRAARRGDLVLLCLPHAAPGTDRPAPAWCRAGWEVTADGRVLRAAPDGTDGVSPATGVTAAWAERTARRLAGLRALGRDPSRPGDGVVPGTDDADPSAPRIPATVALADLLDLSDPAARWARREGWRVPLGRGADGGTVTLDLVADGPHLLVAGTTGAGKSELLQSLVLALAATRSPADLAVALVDFKGGASFGRCAELPHVVGQVTDLEAGLAGRALAGLRAELRRRERVLADHRAPTTDALPPGVLPRLVVVIDEFRALADDLPEFLPGLLRIAAQGRSLGVHLVLATQRPAGAVSADLRANVTTRIALRVVDAADSRDVVEHPAAARIRVGNPGRAVLRVGAGAPVVLQCAHAGATGGGPGDRVRRVPADDGAPPPDLRPVRPDGPAGEDPVAHAVTAARRAAADLGLRPGPAPWLPPLPERVLHDDPGADDPEPAGPDHLPLALADDPDAQCRTLAAWRPRDGHLAVLGPARSGRTTALVTLGRSALERGRAVHVLAPSAAHRAFAVLSGHPGFGTLAGADDPSRARRLLRRLATAPGRDDGPRPLVLVDDVAGLRAVLAGADAWDPLTTALAAGHADVAVTADAATVGGLAARFGPRLVLLGTDRHADVLLGAPQPLAGTGGPPGRGVWLGTDGPRACQVLLPGPGAPRQVHGSACPPRPVRLLPVPTDVTPGRLAAVRDREAPDRSAVVIGLGGDDAAPVGLDVRRGALVVGPRGAGRSTVLRLVVRALARRGRLAAVISRDGALRADAGTAPAAPHTSAAVRRLVGSLEPSAGAVVVDDLDFLAQSCPVESDHLAELLEAGTPVVASATTQGALMAHRGVLAELRGRRNGVVLAPGERGADEVLGTPVADLADPGPPRPGRGALVRSGAAVPLQTVRLDGPADSAEGVLDDDARHEADEDADREEEQDRTTERRGERPAREQGDTQQTLEDLPAGDG